MLRGMGEDGGGDHVLWASMLLDMDAGENEDALLWHSEAPHREVF